MATISSISNNSTTSYYPPIPHYPRHAYGPEDSKPVAQDVIMLCIVLLLILLLLIMHFTVKAYLHQQLKRNQRLYKLQLRPTNSLSEDCKASEHLENV